MEFDKNYEEFESPQEYVVKEIERCGKDAKTSRNAMNVMRVLTPVNMMVVYIALTNTIIPMALGAISCSIVGLGFVSDILASANKSNAFVRNDQLQTNLELSQIAAEGDVNHEKAMDYVVKSIDRLEKLKDRCDAKMSLGMVTATLGAIFSFLSYIGLLGPVPAAFNLIYCLGIYYGIDFTISNGLQEAGYDSRKALLEATYDINMIKKLKK